MPTPHGSRGGMAFSADELRVFRRALAAALRPDTTTPVPDDLQEYLRLAEALDEAVSEGGRLRTFLLAELARYREALPGSATGYLARLRDALDTGYLPGPDDLAALRRLRGHPCGAVEHRRRTVLLRRCEDLAENDLRARLEAHMPTSRRRSTIADRGHLLSLPGGRRESPVPAVLVGSAPHGADTPGKPSEKPARPSQVPAPAPAPSRGPSAPDPGRRVPTPAEVFPPGHRATPPDEEHRTA
ncbi:hypothetical protein [Streptomyces sp. H39-S7]|uniref:hypothetical protein n=1 Tax=Streptomyces sp. H39-S7 TaxID=3004357 RepID=UPI0022B02DF1|nr:hypothetical protein [Streptomyces sp. H39-S7]MCZ4120756.1 hypothetical protein [Streptomyces sp. H39-S7]